MVKKFQVLALGLAAIFVAACNEDLVPSQPVADVPQLNRDLGGFVLDSINLEKQTIYVSPSSKGGDSLKFNDGFATGMQTADGSVIYLATTGDLKDPEIVDWDVAVKDGSFTIMKDASIKIVVLDEKKQPVAVWEIVNTAATAGSSSSKDEASSAGSSATDSTAVAGSSSSAATDSTTSAGSSAAENSSADSATSSSGSKDESSSSEEVVVSSSSEEVESSSSEEVAEESSSSEEIESSDSEESSSSEESGDIESSDSENDGPQLPGSDFSSWDRSFWGSTSDAMATKGSGYWTIFNISMVSQANAVFESSRMTLTTRSVEGKWGIGGGWKMAGGFYFAGSYSGSDAASIYMASNSDACADGCPADFSQYMDFGRPFTGRPVSFDVTYAYKHVDNTNNTYPQSSLIYVALVSADNKIVAAGKISDASSVDMNTKTVILEYGSDAGLIESGAIGVAGLSKGTGDEEVVSIRVMFASSALAYVADGGTSSQMKKNFRGGEGSQLIIDEFKLNY